ncbi:hypothetical protein AVEN_238461-1 [Araneus ventricosus]|uniref:DUF19 domain-containing protein n=1 Tax=Araneus ventricosus TaxID=182803 RepID=A0A4Y2LBR2_ARAVE|nr:hypothetical protein AVEN_238461-1 [Araneus ventricosus]
MWIILVSLFVFAKGEIDCNKHLFEQCPKPKLFREIPWEVNVFKALCPELSSYIKCLRDYDMKCREEDKRIFKKPETSENLIALFDEICDEGSAFNEIATSNLKCFNETFSNTNCRQETDDFVKLYEKEIPVDEFITSHVIPERVYCLSQILLAGCLLEDINRNCGIRVRHATLEYLHRSDFVDGSCPLSYRESLLPDIDEFNLTEEQKTFAISELERMKISDEV